MNDSTIIHRNHILTNLYQLKKQIKFAFWINKNINFFSNIRELLRNIFFHQKGAHTKCTEKASRSNCSITTFDKHYLKHQKSELYRTLTERPFLHILCEVLYFWVYNFYFIISHMNCISWKRIFLFYMWKWSNIARSWLCILV